jgi:hypothetical protein
MDRGLDAESAAAPGDAPRKSWSTPRVIVSEVRSTLNHTAKSPLDKHSTVPDNVTPGGSQGS